MNRKEIFKLHFDYVMNNKHSRFNCGRNGGDIGLINIETKEFISDDNKIRELLSKRGDSQ